MKRWALLLACAGALFALTGAGLRTAGSRARMAPASAAAAHPDFTGEWVLDVGRSQFGGDAHAAKARVDRIVHKDPQMLVRSLTVRPAGDSLALAYRYKTNGEAVNSAMGQDVRTTGRWSGPVLLLESHAKMLMMDLSVTERWSLSADGRMLTEARASKGPMGEVKQVLVFTRR